MATKLRFTDSHCHLDFPAFSNQLPELLQQCTRLNINNIIIPSIGPNNWKDVLSTCQHYSSQGLTLHPSLGIHPWFLDKLDTSTLDALAKIVGEHQHDIVAIGESGIDGKIALEQNNLTQQIDFFEYQLSLAKLYKLPIIIHHRRSHQDIIKPLRKVKLTTGGIIHAFSGSYQQAVQYIDLGFKLGIGGSITYSRAEKTIKAVKRIPLSSMVLETDAPSMPLYGYQGQDNTPLRIIDVFNCLTKIRIEDTETLAHALEVNVQQVIQNKLQ